MSLFRTKEDKHRETCYPYLLDSYNQGNVEIQRLMALIEEQKASVKANREIYKIAENVVREQAFEIELLKLHVVELETYIAEMNNRP